MYTIKSILVDPSIQVDDTVAHQATHKPAATSRFLTNLSRSLKIEPTRYDDSHCQTQYSKLCVPLRYMAPSLPVGVEYLGHKTQVSHSDLEEGETIMIVTRPAKVEIEKHPITQEIKYYSIYSIKRCTSTLSMQG